MRDRTGPLSHLRVVEFEALGPAPFCGMLLADLGADVVRVDRRHATTPLGFGGAADLFGRGKRSIALDLKQSADVERAHKLARSADVVLEGLRPGAMERLGLGPEPLCHANPRLVYGRMTGYGQDGPLAARAGHDANYLAMSGFLHLIGSEAGSVLPHNLLADFGGGGMLLAVGVLAALCQVAHSGRGQVVDTAMVDGVALLGTMTFTLRSLGLFHDGRGQNLFDGAAPFYAIYPTQDGQQYVLAAVEPQFLQQFFALAGVDAQQFGSPMNPAEWPRQRALLATVFAGKTRAEWDALLEGHDTCATPVLSLTEALLHPHHQARATYIEHEGVVQPAPAPRFSATPATLTRAAPERGQHTDEILRELDAAP